MSKVEENDLEVDDVEMSTDPQSEIIKKKCEFLESDIDALVIEISNHFSNSHSLFPKNIEEASSCSSSKSWKRPQAEVRPEQQAVAENMLKRIKTSQPDITRENYDFFEKIVITPAFINLGKILYRNVMKNSQICLERQTVDRMRSFINGINGKLEDGKAYLQDLKSQESEMGVKKNVLRNVTGAPSRDKFEKLEHRIMEEKRTFFYIIHDEGNDWNLNSSFQK